VWWAAAVVLCAVVIFYLSTKGFNIDWSLRLLDGTLRSFGLALSPHTLFHWDRVVRKLAHVTEYALLAPVLYHTLRPSTEDGWHLRLGLLSILGSALYAASDELHQLFVPGRNGSVSDWCIDMAGATLGISAVYLWARLFPQNSKRSAASTESTEAK
jgi:VanZ family protein